MSTRNISDPEEPIDSSSEMSVRRSRLLESTSEGKKSLELTVEKKPPNHLPKPFQLALLIIGMFVFFSTHNLLQEAMMKLPDFKYGVMLGYLEVVGVTVGSFIERKYVAKETERKAPLKAYPLLTICLLASSSLSNMSLNYINFPTKVVFRSCKLVPTMVIASIFNKRIFLSVEYVLAFAVCLGLILFAAAEWKLAPTFHPIGLVLVSLSVVADSILPNAQERLFNLGSSRIEVTFFTNIYTLIAMTFTTIFSGDLFGFANYAMGNSTLCIYVGVYIAVSYIAISLFMQIVKKFGAVAGVLAGTARKAMSLVLSFLIFPKEYSWLYTAGSILVLGGLLASSFVKMNKGKSSRDGSGASESRRATNRVESKV